MCRYHQRHKVKYFNLLKRRCQMLVAVVGVFLLKARAEVRAFPSQSLQREKPEGLTLEYDEHH